MKRFLAALILGVGTFGLLGCAEETKVTKTEEATGPGGTTEFKNETGIKQSGENPPPITTPETPAAPK